MQRNAYFAHPEAILLSMLADEDGEVRAQAVNAILTIRMKSNQRAQLKFMVMMAEEWMK